MESFTGNIGRKERGRSEESGPQKYLGRKTEQSDERKRQRNEQRRRR